MNKKPIVQNGESQILSITGGNRLSGEVVISGSKNATLPIMAASLLAKGDFTLTNIPNLADVRVFKEVLKDLGCVTDFNTGRCYIDTNSLGNNVLNPDLIGRMRASVLVMGPLLARFNEVTVPLPGGCSLGPRPIDYHLFGFKLLGAEISDINGTISLYAPKGLRGTIIDLPFPSVGATENLMMAATLAKGMTVIENAAREPEIVDLAEFLNMMGAEINGAGTRSITIRGVNDLHSVNYSVIPDRIETASFLMAGLITGGDVTCVNASPWHLPVILEKLEEAGCELIIDTEKVGIKSPPRPKSVGAKTTPYPGFATDVQPMLMAAMTIADGENIFMDTIFENRFNQIKELIKMGADIEFNGRVALVRGIDNLTGCDVAAPDIRAAMALVIAGLKADGETRISNLEHLLRGYENPVEKLTALGADLKITEETLDTKTDTTQPDKTPVSDEATVSEHPQSDDDSPVVSTN